jgi:hypothetical protein
MRQRRRGDETVAIGLKAPAQLQQRQIMAAELFFLTH